MHKEADIRLPLILGDKSYKDITEDIVKDIEIANLVAVQEIDDSYRASSQTIYQRSTTKRFSTNTRANFRPFLASREEFFKGAILVENDSEFIIRKDLFLNTNIKYSLADNLDDLYIPPVDVFPAQVRSDVKEYLKNMKERIVPILCLMNILLLFYLDHMLNLVDYFLNSLKMTLNRSLHFVLINQKKLSMLI